MDVAALKLGSKDGRLLLTIHAKPRAKKSQIRGIRDGGLEVAVAAPPVDGAANAEIQRVLGEWLAVPKRDIELVRGASGREKVFAVAGHTDDSLRAALAHAVVQQRP